MDILDEVFGAPEGNLPLENLVVDVGQGLRLPKNAVRNRASLTSLLSGDADKAVDNYRLMLAEEESGQDVLGKQLREQAVNSTQKLDMKGVMSVLADPTIPIEEKDKAIAALRDSHILKDQATTLFTNSVAKASKGETLEAEDARLSSLDAIRDIYEARNRIQGLVNAHGAALQDVGPNTLGEMIELYLMPFGNNINAGKVNSTIQTSTWDKVKGFLLAGTTTANLRERLESIPPEKRVDFAKTLIDTISKNSGIVFSNDNQFAQFDKAQSIFAEGGYSSTQEFLDNVSPLLDVLGIGQVVRGLGKANRVAKTTTIPTITPPANSSEVFVPKRTTLAEAISGFSKEDFATTPLTFPYKGSLDSAPVKQPTPGGSVLLGGTGRKVEEVKKQVPALFKPETTEQLVARVRKEVDEALDRITMNRVVRQENPSSPAAIIQQANPEQARAVHASVVASKDNQTAEAFYGTSREQAIVNDLYPQVEVNGKVTSMVVDIERNVRQELNIPPELVELVHNTGATYYTKEEKAAARANLVNQFSHAEGMTMNEAMSSFTIEGGRIKISAVYGTPEGSFVDPVDAFRQAKLALRNYGVLDSEIKVLRKEGLDHVPFGIHDEIPSEPGNYLVRVETYHDIDPTDISKFETFDVKRNLFDRVPVLVTDRKGSVSRYLFDAASMLHPTYTSAASNVSDQTARFGKFMLTLADEFAQKVTKLDASRKAKMDEYLKEANFNEIAFDTTDLTARGFTANEIDAIRSWRQFWDAHYYLENYDLVRTLNSQGYQLFRNRTTELYAKPIAKNQNLGKIYDPATDSVITHTKAEGDALYNSGGTYARLRRPTDFNGVTAEYMIVRNTPTEYLRKFRDSDKVLNYRNGYFQIQYQAPRFVDEVKPDGTIRTVAVAGDYTEANHFAKRMATTTGFEYRVRGDERALRRGEDTWWDIHSAAGRIAQRHRGKLLEDASGLNHLGDSTYIVNPVDSAMAAAKSISGRTVSRPMLEAAKARFINQYSRLLPSDGMGGVKWPNRVSDIGAKGEHTSKEVADARTTYEYINYLENGYVNSIDDMFKAAMNGFADMLGRAGMSRAERAAVLASDSAPTSLAKNTVFMAYIGSNPLRQLIVQPHQAVRTFSYNPMALANGNLYRLPAEYLGWKAGLTNSTDFAKFVEDSGLLDAVDKGNLVRGTLVDAADSTNKVIRMMSRAGQVPRKVGFDIGEQANLLAHLASVYDAYKRGGKNLADRAVRDAAYAEARAISYDMNFAGDLPYNQTSPSMILQFMQVPHKAFLQMTNRKLSPAVRARLLTGDMLFWGVPGAALISNVMGKDVLPDNPELREVFLWGLESYAINHAIDSLVEGDVNIDFSSLAPYDMTGWGKLFQSFYEGGLHDLFFNSPSGQLFFKDGSRFEMAMKSMGRYFGMVEDDDEDPETFISVMNEVAKISSGYNNALKAKLLLDAERRLDQYGNTVDKSVNHVEAWAQVFGFGTADTRDLYRMTVEMSKDTKAHREDVIKVYEDVKRYYAEKLAVDNNDPKFVTKVTGRMLRMFKDDPAALSIIQQQMSKDLAGKDNDLLLLFMRRSGIPDLGGLKDQVNQMPVSDEQKQQMLQMIEDMKAAREKLKESK